MCGLQKSFLSVQIYFIVFSIWLGCGYPNNLTQLKDCVHGDESDLQYPSTVSIAFKQEDFPRGMADISVSLSEFFTRLDPTLTDVSEKTPIDSSRAGLCSEGQTICPAALCLRSRGGGWISAHDEGVPADSSGG